MGKATAILFVLFLNFNVAMGDDATPGNQELLKLIKQQQRVLDNLKQLLQNTQLEQKSKKTISQNTSNNDLVTEKFQFGGSAEFELTHTELFIANTNTSDASLSKVNLYFDLHPHEMVKTHIQAVFEEQNGTELELDEDWLTLGKTAWPAALTFGKFVIPFGAFNTNMVSDPLGLSLAETTEFPIQLGYTVGPFSGFIFGFNGDTQEPGQGTHFDKFGANLKFGGEIGGNKIDLGMSYISSMAETDTIEGALTSSTSMTDGDVPGITINALMRTGPFTGIIENIAALGAFNNADLAFTSSGVARSAQPETLQLEIGYTTNIVQKEVVFAAKYQKSFEGQALSLSEEQWGLAVTVALYDRSSAAAEHMTQDDYSSNDGGTGLDGHLTTFKLTGELYKN